jgi:SAM-dependent methyltransferase
MFELLPLATTENFSESAYLAANPDVREAVNRGLFACGRDHFDFFGHRESRRLALTEIGVFHDLKQKKLAFIEPLLRADLPREKRESCYDFLTPELRAEFSIIDTSAVSSNGYDGEIIELIQRNDLVLDCGAGYRPTYYENVVNFEIVEYPSTDVVGVGEVLPFKDASFDAVISNAVLEHVKYPWVCAAEIVRVLKPGGELFCSVPFLQPLHGYPHHYFNMTSSGLKTVFGDEIEVVSQYVAESTLPIWSLSWILRNWHDGLPEIERQGFSELTVGELMGSPESFLERPFVTQLPEDKNFELASATVLLGRKKSA